MAYTVNSSFNKFIDVAVNLNPTRTAQARQSRNWLVQQIEDLASSGKIPPLHDEYNPMFYGSFARNTKIKPLDDIDIIVTFHAQWCTANSVEKNYIDPYQIHYKDDAFLLPKYGDNGILNSRKMIEGLKKELGNISSYQKADIHRNQEAVTLKLSSYEWNFDIIPAFYTTTGFFMIPDGNGAWKGTDPRIDQSRVTAANKRCEGGLLPLIRLMKYWKNIYWGKSVSSYLFENLMITWANRFFLYSTSYPILIRNILNSLAREILIDFNDPKGFQGNINYLDTNERIRLSSIAQQCVISVDEAIQYENAGLMSSAIDKWIEIFGQNFPAYGK